MNNVDRTGEFVGLFAAHDRVIYKYILTLLGNAESADEVFQETSMVLWKKFGEFLPESNFGAWACRVAYFEVLKFRQTARRDRLLFSDDLVGALAEQRTADADVLEERRLALRECLKKLGPHDRVLIEHRYGGTETIKQIAKRLGRPANTLYKALERIRHTLFECINKTVSAK